MLAASGHISQGGFVQVEGSGFWFRVQCSGSAFGLYLPCSVDPVDLKQKHSRRMRLI